MRKKAETYSPDHGRAVWHGRCVLCGHRVAENGVAPRQTRSNPPWTWPGEIIGRMLARRAGNPLREVIAREQ